MNVVGNGIQPPFLAIMGEPSGFKKRLNLGRFFVAFKWKSRCLEVICDRGRNKWVSMMLPEHVKLLKEYNECLDKVEKPVLDEQKDEEFNEVICEAMEENIALQITFYQKGDL